MAHSGSPVVTTARLLKREEKTQRPVCSSTPASNRVSSEETSSPVIASLLEINEPQMSDRFPFFFKWLRPGTQDTAGHEGSYELGTCAKWHLVPWRISRIIPLTVVHKPTCWLSGHHSAAALICLIWAAANDSLLDCFLPLKSPRPSPLCLITSTSRHVRKTAEGSTC